jgi:hypothetical protein
MTIAQPQTVRTGAIPRIWRALVPTSVPPTQEARDDAELLQQLSGLCAKSYFNKKKKEDPVEYFRTSSDLDYASQRLVFGRGKGRLFWRALGILLIPLNYLMILAWVVALIAPLFVVGALTEALLHYLFGWSVYPFTWLLETSPDWLWWAAVLVGGSGLLVGLVMAFAPRLASARAFGLLDSRTNRAIVVFCGSEKKDNITINALVWPYYFPMRHMGFHRAWYHIRPEIRQWLKDAVSAGQAKEVVLTGHSLGGALAQVAAYDLAGELPISHVVSLGSACIGGPGMRDRFAEREVAGGGKLNARHFTYTLDMMPRIPPSSIFRQVGRRFRLPDHGGPVEGTEGGLIPSSWIFFLETISIIASLFLNLITIIRNVAAKIFRFRPAERDANLSATGLNQQGRVTFAEAWDYFSKLVMFLPGAVPSVLLVVAIAIVLFPFVLVARLYIYYIVMFATGLAVQHAAGNYRDAFRNHAASFKT